MSHTFCPRMSGAVFIRKGSGVPQFKSKRSLLFIDLESIKDRWYQNYDVITSTISPSSSSLSTITNGLAAD